MEVIKAKDKKVVIKVENLDVKESDKLRLEAMHLLNEGFNNFEIDMNNSRYFNVTSLGVLVMINRFSKERGGHGVVLKNVDFQALQIIKATRMNKVLKIIND